MVKENQLVRPLIGWYVTKGREKRGETAEPGGKGTKKKITGTRPDLDRSIKTKSTCGIKETGPVRERAGSACDSERIKR